MPNTQDDSTTGTLVVEEKPIADIDTDETLGDHSEELSTVTSEDETKESKSEESTDSDDELDLSIIDEDEEPGSSDTEPIIKPLAFVDKLEEADKNAYLQQLAGGSKAIEQNRELRAIIGDDRPEALKNVVTHGADYLIMLNDLSLADRRENAVAFMLETIEEATGLAIEELLPERFGQEVDPIEIEKRKLEKENAELRQNGDFLKKVADWKQSEGPQVVDAFAKRSGGFKPNIDAVAPLIASGKTPIQAVREAQAREWEKHLFEQGKKAGQKAAVKETTPDTLGTNKGGGLTVEYYPKGHELAGQVRRR